MSFGAEAPLSLFVFRTNCCDILSLSCFWALITYHLLTLVRFVGEISFFTLGIALVIVCFRIIYFEKVKGK